MPVPDKRPRTLRSAADLVAAGLLAPEQAAAAERAARTLPVAVTPAILGRILAPDDAVARQFVPSAAELEFAPEELADPIGDDAHTPLKGIVHRYPDRVLLKPLLVCPVYCRFCFRREAVGPDGGALSEAELDAALAYIAARPAIWEVILTGGEPLMLAPAKLAMLLDRIAAIPHVASLRIHTRVPVSDPERVTPALLAALRREPPVWLVVHCNHPQELGEPARAALRLLADGGIPLLGQTVLLKGVNADVETLDALMRALVRNRVKPYYLHHPDLVRGTGHFRLTIDEGRDLVRALRGRLSGIAQPTYVLDIPGGHGKVPAGPSWVDDGSVEDGAGGRHRYPPDRVP